MSSPQRHDAVAAAPAAFPGSGEWIRWALRRSYRTHRRMFLLTYGIVIATCGVATLIPFWAGRTTLYAFADVRDVDGPLGGAMTAFSAFCLAGTGLLCGVVGRHVRLVRRAEAPWWYLAGIGAVFLACDELLQWHEALTLALAAQGVPKLFGVVDQDVYIFAGYAVTAGLLIAKLSPTIARCPRALLPLGVAVLCFGVSSLVDMVPWERLDHLGRGVLGPLEEISKTLGSWSVLLYGVLLHEKLLAQPAAGRSRRGAR